MSLETQTVDFGDSANYTCESRGGPNNMFEWYFNGNKILGDQFNYTIDTTSTHSILTLDSVIGLVHGGSYTCNVENAAGYESANAMLLVRPSVVADPISSIDTSNGSMIQLMCEGDAYPAPTYSWERMTEDQLFYETINGTGSNDGFAITYSDSESILSLQPVSLGDEGYYRCVISSSGYNAVSNSSIIYGKHLSSPCFILLIFLSVAPDETEIIPLEVNSFNGATEILRCSALGGPDNIYNFIYLRTGEVFEDVDTIMITIGIDTGGSYQCTVSNSAGSDEAFAIVNGKQNMVYFNYTVLLPI